MPLRTHQIMPFQMKNSKIFWGGGTASSLNPTPCGKGDTPLLLLAPLAPPSAPQTQRLWCFSLDAFGVSVSSPASLFLNLGRSVYIITLVFHLNLIRVTQSIVQFNS